LPLGRKRVKLHGLEMHLTHSGLRGPLPRNRNRLRRAINSNDLT
jgi:hypothetical protein